MAETVQDFQFVVDGSADTPSVVSATVLSGGAAVYRLQVAPVNGSTFAGDVTLALAGLPAGASYTVSPATIAAGSGTQTITVAVQTGRTMAQSRPSRPVSTGAVLACGLLFPFFGMAWIPLQQRRKHTRCLLLLAVVAILAIAGMSGCGAVGSGFQSQAPQTHSLTLTGTSGALQRSVDLTLIVK